MLASLVVSYLEMMLKSGSLHPWAARPLASNHKSQFETIVIQSWSHHKIITAAIKAHFECNHMLCDFIQLMVDNNAP